jgi:type IV pilus assembly protein PilB
VRKKLGETLVQAGLISEDDLRVALAEHKRSGERLGGVFVRLNIASERQIAKAVAYQLGFPYVNLSEYPPDPDVITLIPKDVALKRLCVALRLDKNVLTVAMADPLLFSLVQDLEFQTRNRIKQVVATAADILEAIGVGYGEAPAAAPSPPVDAAEPIATPGSLSPAPEPDAARAEAPRDDASVPRRPDVEVPESINLAKDSGDPAPIIDLVDLVMKGALKNSASDVHLEPFAQGVLVRHRLDGLLKDVMELPKWVHEGLIARIKIMAGMDIAEKRLPQEGRIRITSEDGREIDFRASTLRTLHGEKLVLRALDIQQSVPALEELGFSTGALTTLQGFLRHPHGMVLVVGPTGSGKSTTLCSALLSLRSEQRNIVTVEDQIEYQLDGVNQTQVQERIKLTFASALRSILRQDPDVIFVSELRDEETARMSMQAARSSHLVLSALHSDDTPSAIMLLMDMGVESYLTASALIGVVAQRLVRRLCPNCKRQYTPPPELLRALQVTEQQAESVSLFKAVGCDQCHQTGYRGRIGIYEVTPVSDRLRRLIASRARHDAIHDAAHDGGQVTLSDDAMAKVNAGQTTPEEMLRVMTGTLRDQPRAPRKSAKMRRSSSNVKEFKKV